MGFLHLVGRQEKRTTQEFMCKSLKLPIPTSITWDDSDSESDTAVVYVSKSRLADLQRANDVSQAALLELVDPTGLAETQPS